MWISSVLPWRSCAASSDSLGALFPGLARCLDPLSTKLTTPLSNPITQFSISLIYVLSIVLLRLYVVSRRPSFPHKPFFTALACGHNVLLCLMSLLMNLHCTYVIYMLSQRIGFSHTICNPPSDPLPLPAQTTLYLFLASKLYELLDTPILVLRGRPPTFLHVWHHASVAVEVWGWLHHRVSLGLYGMWFNTLVHVIMYAYYAAALYIKKIPAKRLITLTQIVQFLTGFASLLPFAYIHLSSPSGCAGLPGLLISAAINGSYLILFLFFFRNTYKAPRIKRL